MIERHLAEALRHVADGNIIVERQRGLIANLQRDGHDSSEAESLLKIFLETQALHEHSLDHVRIELRDLDRNAL